MEIQIENRLVDPAGKEKVGRTERAALNIYTAAAAKSLQSCLTLSDPMDCSLPGSSIHGIFQARVLEWGAIAFSKHIHYAMLC